MSTLDTPGDSAISRLPSKRKLEDYGDGDDDLPAIHTFRMRKSETEINCWTPSSDAGFQGSVGASVSGGRSFSSCVDSPSGAESSWPGSRLQFFVKMMSGKTLVVQADCNDTVKSLHERIQLLTCIPLMDQRLIYEGKQLQWEQSLAECSIQNDAGLQLVGRMRSTGYPLAWKAIHEMLSQIWKLCRGDGPVHELASSTIKGKLREFLTMTPTNNIESAAGHLKILLSMSAPVALVILYSSTIDGNKEVADDTIRSFLKSCSIVLPKPIHSQCAPVVLEFCKLLGTNNHEDSLYLLCRSTLGSLVETVGFSPTGSEHSTQNKASIGFEEIAPLVSDIAHKLSKDLVSKVESPANEGPLHGDVHDFSSFLVPLRTAIHENVGFQGPIAVPLQGNAFSHPYYEGKIEFLHFIFCDLLKNMDQCLQKIEECLKIKKMRENESLCSGCSQYLSILKELNSISRLYKGDEERFWSVLRARKFSVRALVCKYAKRIEDNKWILEHKEVTDFESRRHLVMMLLPELKDEYDELHEMLIDRSQLLAESFEYIGHAKAGALHSGIFMEFKNEEATGPGVLREWFVLVCQAIFNPQNALFVACPNDRRRFYPNPSSKVDPLHLEYFVFSGRVVALALMHKVHVGLVLDRSFFVQLAGRSVSLEDIRDADPDMYNSCKNILEMDAEIMDADALGLTFATEFEELGSRKVVELCPGGHNIVVNSLNRKKYIACLIQNRFVTSVSDQVYKFAKGFADIMCKSNLRSLFFRSIDLEDLDKMLYGSESDICVEDWKAHTEYNGYTITDTHISWFWEIVGIMSAEQKRTLLFFWTSVKYLPVEGFGGLASRLHIERAWVPTNQLPTSHTCFHRLCFPPYPSKAVMRDRFGLVTEEHVSCSFGDY